MNGIPLAFRSGLASRSTRYLARRGFNGEAGGFQPRMN
jgi:hypothetical protein